ncbi:thermonuclease family protein [Candidatus Saccharibacteria bacterium]|nr:thermonuclease family protein [Candidatus Saccharibacteria bacterium]
MTHQHSKKILGLALSLALVVTGAFGFFSKTASAATFPVYRVAGIWANSADTLLVIINGKLTKVRIIGIDAPEATSRANTKKGCYATQAKNVLRNLTRGQFVRLESDPKLPDKYSDGSLLRYVYINANRDVGATMILNGAAKEYMYQHKNYTWRSWYKNLQTTAYNSNRGIWSSSICPMNR